MACAPVPAPQSSLLMSRLRTVRPCGSSGAQHALASSGRLATFPLCTSTVEASPRRCHSPLSWPPGAGTPQARQDPSRLRCALGTSRRAAQGPMGGCGVAVRPGPSRLFYSAPFTGQARAHSHGACRRERYTSQRRFASPERPKHSYTRYAQRRAPYVPACLRTCLLAYLLACVRACLRTCLLTGCAARAAATRTGWLG